MSQQTKSGLLIAAPLSGSGKTVMTLALIRALSNKGVEVCGAKAGPDYIDPAFHSIAAGIESVNLDPWAMQQKRLNFLFNRQKGDHVLVEAMMGLFDGAADGKGAAADLAKILDIPVVMVVDAARQSHSIAALVRGFRDHDHGVKIAGVILNRVGSQRHEAMLRDALETINMNVVGAVPRDERLSLPERHLGLVQAGEKRDIDAFIETAAGIVDSHCNLDDLVACFKPVQTCFANTPLRPLGQRIAIAKDEAFSFVYSHMLADWREQGAELSFFSPLANEGPFEAVDAVFLPGGYPELHGGKIASADKFQRGIRQSAKNGTLVYGECGGYMVLGEGLVDSDGHRHSMCGLLGLETSFEVRKLHLGYRKIRSDDFVLGSSLWGHEFHYSSVLREVGESLFAVRDALDTDLGGVGLRSGTVMGSYMHIIDGSFR